MTVRSEVAWPTIPAMVRDAARRFGDADAVVDGDRRVTFAELATLGRRRAARALCASGVEPGDRVAVWAPNSLEWIVAALGVTTAGAVLVPVNTRFRGAEAAYILARSGARVLFTVRGFLDTDYPALLADAGVEPPGARAHGAPVAVRPTRHPCDWDDVPRPRRRRDRRRARRAHRRRSAPTTRATSCSRRARPAARRAW